MRPTLIAAAAAVLAAGVAGPASAALRLDAQDLRLLVQERGGTRAPALVARVGQTVRFEVGYRVGGAARVATGHRFVVRNALTGRRMRVSDQAFPPGAPGDYVESSELTIPARWAPGVYRLTWTLTARAHGRARTAGGSGVFLVLGRG
jgi:hypothetical protein